MENHEIVEALHAVRHAIESLEVRLCNVAIRLERNISGVTKNVHNLQAALGEWHHEVEHDKEITGQAIERVRERQVNFGRELRVLKDKLNGATPPHIGKAGGT